MLTAACGTMALQDLRTGLIPKTRSARLCVQMVVCSSETDFKEFPMSRQLALVPLIVFASLSYLVQAADEAPRMQTVLGTIENVGKESLTIKQKGSDGKSETKMTFKLTGTSRFSMLSTQKRGDKIVFVQKDAEVKNLAEKQTIAVIYATNAEDHVLLSAVVHAE